MLGPLARFGRLSILMLVALGFYTVARLEFLIWNWSLFQSKDFADILWAFVVGLRFDISAVLSITAPVILFTLIPWPLKWQKAWVWFSGVTFGLLHIPFYILNLGDTEFINFVGRRFSYDGLFVFGEVPGKFLSFVQTYWILFLINTLLVVLFTWSILKIMRAPSQTRHFLPMLSRWKAWGVYGVASFFVLAFSIIGIRGGLQSKPVNFVSANVFAAPLLNNLVLNSSFTFIKSYGAEDIRREKYFASSEDLLPLLNGSQKGSLLERHRPTGPMNVIIIILESFGREYVGPYNGQTLTPFLDSLAQKSLVFQNAYANGRRSIEGIAAIMAGIPAMMSEPFISSHFTSNYFLGLGTLLAKEGYSSSFFHGGRNGTMYFDSFMQSVGVENYFGASEYPIAADDDGTWGIWDEPFLQWMVEKLGEQTQPFLSSVFTLSSHHPFRIPEKYKDRFPEGKLDILKTISYTDFALQKFFESAQTQPWFANTLFVITADHTSKHFRPEYDNEIGNYRVPLMLYHPGWKFPEINTQMVAQHIDVMPTILDVLNIRPVDQNFLGSSLFVPGDKVAVNFIDGRYLLTAQDYQLHWVPGSGEPQMYAITDVMAKTPLEEPVARKEELIRRMKATIQYFNEGMWDNKLYYPSVN